MRRKPLFPPPLSAATGKKKRHKGRQAYSLLTINGRIRLRRVRWHCPQQGSETPSDAWLDAAEATIREGVREMACRVNQDASSFQKAAENLRRTVHIETCKETVRQLVEAEGRAVLRAMQRGQLRPDWSAVDCTTPQQTTRLYVGCDGVKVPLVTDGEKKKRRQAIRDNDGVGGVSANRCRRPGLVPTIRTRSSKWAICMTNRRSVVWWASPPVITKRRGGCCGG